MTSLYTNLSAIYQAMYQSFINYQEEYNFYSAILVKYKCQSLLEVGCGSGNLASLFTQNGFNFMGMDLSNEMLSIAKQNNNQAVFINGDMRDFNLQTKVDACIITGRTISYLITNKDVAATFKAISKNLKSSGIICFDCIDANKFIPLINPQEKIIHQANFKNKKYQRDSYWNVNLSNGFTFDWASFYYEENNDGDLIKIGEDAATIRAFTKDEMVLFLQLAGFMVKEIINKPCYAFDTFVIIAQKIN